MTVSGCVCVCVCRYRNDLEHGNQSNEYQSLFRTIQPIENQSIQSETLQSWMVACIPFMSYWHCILGLLMVSGWSSTRTRRCASPVISFHRYNHSRPTMDWLCFHSMGPVRSCLDVGPNQIDTLQHRDTLEWEEQRFTPGFCLVVDVRLLNSWRLTFYSDE